MNKVLVNAYAVSPGMGSELGVGWNWCVGLARDYELHIITEGEYRTRIEAALPSLPQGKNMHFHYLPVSERIRKMCWNQGDWRFYFHYRRWQKRALEEARRICREERIDLIHHLNMIGFREPGYLWKIPSIAYVHGPINCKIEYPLSFWKEASVAERSKIILKEIISRFQLRYSFRFRQAIRRADAVITASSDSRRMLKKYLGRDSVLINETGCDSEPVPRMPFSKDGLDILWVGRFALYSKLPALALRAVRRASHPDLKIHFVGPGDDSAFRELAESMGIADKCHWYGPVSHEEVLAMMRTMDVFLMTSVAEGTPHVVLEAISCGLPVVCIDTCGQGDIVDEWSGIKVPLTNPQQVEKDLADALDRLAGTAGLLETLSEGCLNRRLELSWDATVCKATTIYHNLLCKL